MEATCCEGSPVAGRLPDGTTRRATHGQAASEQACAGADGSVQPRASEAQHTPSEASESRRSVNREVGRPQREGTSLCKTPWWPFTVCATRSKTKGAQRMLMERRPRNAAAPPGRAAAEAARAAADAGSAPGNRGKPQKRRRAASRAPGPTRARANVLSASRHSPLCACLPPAD